MKGSHEVPRTTELHFSTAFPCEDVFPKCSAYNQQRPIIVYTTIDRSLSRGWHKGISGMWTGNNESYIRVSFYHFTISHSLLSIPNKRKHSLGLTHNHHHEDPSLCVACPIYKISCAITLAYALELLNAAHP